MVTTTFERKILELDKQRREYKRQFVELAPLQRNGPEGAALAIQMQLIGEQIRQLANAWAWGDRSGNRPAGNYSAQ